MLLSARVGSVEHVRPQDKAEAYLNIGFKHIWVFLLGRQVALEAVPNAAVAKGPSVRRRAKVPALRQGPSREARPTLTRFSINSITPFDRR